MDTEYINTFFEAMRSLSPEDKAEDREDDKYARQMYVRDDD